MIIPNHSSLNFIYLMKGGIYFKWRCYNISLLTFVYLLSWEKSFMLVFDKLIDLILFDANTENKDKLGFDSIYISLNY